MRVILHAEIPEDADLEGKQGFISSICGNFATVTRSSAPFSVYWPAKLLTPYEPPQPSDSDLRISVAKLREVLENRIPPYSDPKFVVAEVDQIINKIKPEL